MVDFRYLDRPPKKHRQAEARRLRKLNALPINEEIMKVGRRKGKRTKAQRRFTL
jgi:hypothetical protein